MKLKNVFAVGLFMVVVMLVLAAVPGLRAEEAQPAAGKAETAPECSLLDDAVARATMSGMFETKLLLACGRADELGGVASPDSGDSPLFGADVLVNDPAPEVAASSRTQSETSIAVNEDTGTICSAYNDGYGGVIAGTGYTGFSSSTDGGATFIDHGGLGSSSFGDPSLIWRDVDGKFYLFTLHSSGLGLWRSDDDCTTFTFVGTPHTGGGDDKELAAVDNDLGSPYYGRIYMAWTNFSAGGAIQHTYSDNTTTWSSPITISAGGDVQGAWPTTAPGGDVYVSWVRWNPYYTGPIDIEVVRSTNGGTSFSFVTDPMSGEINPRASSPTSSCGRPALNGNIRYLPSPQIAVSANGDLHVVYSYDQDGLNTGDVVDVFYRRSTDDGATWLPEVQLNDDGTLTDQFFPTVSVDDGNRVVSTWYDRRNDVGGNLLFDYYMRVSEDGGATWAPSERVSDVSSPVVLDPNLATCYHGDYDTQVQYNGLAYIQWSDDRTVQSTDPNVWFDQNAFAPDFTLSVTPQEAAVCAPTDATYLVDVGSILGFSDSVDLDTAGEPAGATINFSVDPVTPPGNSTLTVGTAAVAAGGYSFDVTGTSTTGTKSYTIGLDVFDAAGTASLVSPPNGAVNVPLSPTFTWTGTGTSYTIEIATDAGFTNIVETATVAGTSYTAGPLGSETEYFWRVFADNACGGGESQTWSFTTASGTFGCNSAVVDFESGLPVDWTVVVSTGPVYWSTTDDLAACDNGGNQTLGSGDAACADSDQTNIGGDPYDTELWTNTFDLSGFNAVTLEFAGNYNDISPGGGDMFEVWVWDGSSWTMEASWDADFNQIVSLDLSAYGGLPVVAVSFRYHGDGWDWWAQVDDVTLTCEGDDLPQINVDPLFIGSVQETNTVTNHPLDIENVGTANLDWFIEEDNSAMPVGLWSDNFDSYATGADLHGMGGWKGWGNDPTFTAFTTDVQAVSLPNSVDIAGNSDLVHEYTGATSGQWTYTAWQYVPGNMSGLSYFILLNQYDDAGVTNNWSVQVNFDAGLGLVTSDNDGATLPLLADQWVELRLEIDLDADVQTFYYGGTELYTKSWADGVSGGGILNIGAVDLFANGATSVYYDDMSLDENLPMPDVCDIASDIPWASVAPDNGTTTPGNTTTVDVEFDATGLLAGTYTGVLCVHSNDPDPGPGNGTDLVIVDLEMTVQSPTDVSLSSFSGSTNAAVLPMLMALISALVVGFGLVLRRRSVTE